MDVVVTPAIAVTERRALLLALERTGVDRPGVPQHDRTWWRAGLCEAIEGDDHDAAYAFSPRSTRGATRA